MRPNVALIAGVLLLPLATFLWVTTLSYRTALLFGCDTETIIPPESGGVVGNGKESSTLRVLLVADAHVIGPRRSSLDQLWTNWHIGVAFEHALRYARPDIVLGLGDLLDDGRRTMGTPLWSEYSAVGLQAMRPHLLRRVGSASHDDTKPRFFGIVGNHDVGWRNALSSATVELFEQVFFDGDSPLLNVAPANFLWRHELVDIVRINSMALDPHLPSNDRLREDTWDFVDSTAAKLRQDRSSSSSSSSSASPKPLLLLTHMPLHRPNDLQCGDKRTSEGGGVTYKAPHEALIPDDEVLNAEASERLLATLQPDVVFSGHVHARCVQHHPIVASVLGESAIAGGTRQSLPEITVSAFGWRMRPDASFAIADLRVDQQRGTLVSLELETCPLPHEHVLYAVLALAAVAECGLCLCLLFRRCRRQQQPKLHKGR